MPVREIFEAQIAIEEAREKYCQLSTFAKQQAGPVLNPMIMAIENLVKVVAEIKGERNGG